MPGITFPLNTSTILPWEVNRIIILAKHASPKWRPNWTNRRKIEKTNNISWIWSTTTITTPKSWRDFGSTKAGFKVLSFMQFHNDCSTEWKKKNPEFTCGIVDSICCAHGNLLLDASNRKLVASVVWEYLHSQFPEAPEYSSSVPAVTLFDTF